MTKLSSTYLATVALIDEVPEPDEAGRCVGASGTDESVTLPFEGKHVGLPEIDSIADGHLSLALLVGLVKAKDELANAGLDVLLNVANRLVSPEHGDELGAFELAHPLRLPCAPVDDAARNDEELGEMAT